LHKGYLVFNYMYCNCWTYWIHIWSWRHLGPLLCQHLAHR
jgi:hypothetical protein